MHSFQNEQDSRHYARAADSAEAIDLPVLLKMCTRESHSQSIVEPGERVECIKEYVKNGSLLKLRKNPDRFYTTWILCGLSRI